MTTKPVLFPGSVEEYERFVGYAVEIVDTGKREKYLFDGEREDFVKSNRIEAIVNVSFKAPQNEGWSAHPYGLPVKKKI